MNRATTAPSLCSPFWANCWKSRCSGEANQLLIYAQENSDQDRVLAALQFAVSGKSTEEALAYNFAWIQDKFAKDMQVSGLFLDVSGAYDRVTRQCLLEIMARRGVPDRLMDIMCSYLSGRRTILSFPGHESAELNISLGVAQGSPLSSILFAFYTSEILREFASGAEPATLYRRNPFLLWAYADDFNLVVCGKSHEDNWLAISKLHKHLLQFCNLPVRGDVPSPPDPGVRLVAPRTPFFPLGISFSPKKYAIIDYKNPHKPSAPRDSNFRYAEMLAILDIPGLTVDCIVRDPPPPKRTPRSKNKPQPDRECPPGTESQTDNGPEADGECLPDAESQPDNGSQPDKSTHKVTHRVLGLMVDRGLTFQYHVDHLVASATRRLNLWRFMAPASQGLTPAQLRRLYITEIRPMLTYASAAWFWYSPDFRVKGGLQAARIDKLRALQAKFLERISGAQSHSGRTFLERDMSVQDIALVMHKQASEKLVLIAQRNTKFRNLCAAQSYGARKPKDGIHPNIMRLFKIDDKTLIRAVEKKPEDANMDANMDVNMDVNDPRRLIPRPKDDPKLTHNSRNPFTQLLASSLFYFLAPALLASTHAARKQQGREGRPKQNGIKAWLKKAGYAWLERHQQKLWETEVPKLSSVKKRLESPEGGSATVPIRYRGSWGRGLLDIYEGLDRAQATTLARLRAENFHAFAAYSRHFVKPGSADPAAPNDGICPECHQAPETVKHVLLECKKRPIRDLTAHPNIGHTVDLQQLLTTHADITTTWVLAFCHVPGFEHLRDSFVQRFRATLPPHLIR